MSVTIRQAGNEWLIEVHGESVGTASTEAQAQVLADHWAAKLKWVATWRFAQEPVVPTR
jgi:hypothetical protein